MDYERLNELVRGIRHDHEAIAARRDLLISFAKMAVDFNEYVKSNPGLHDVQLASLYITAVDNWFDEQRKTYNADYSELEDRINALKDLFPPGETLSGEEWRQ